MQNPNVQVNNYLGGLDSDIRTAIGPGAASAARQPMIVSKQKSYASVSLYPAILKINYYRVF